MANFPGSLDSLTNPTPSDQQNSPSHSGQHATANDILEAVELKVGTGSSTPSSGTVLTGTGAGTSAWSGLAVLSRTVTLTDDQIKGLPNSPAELVPAPGAGKMLLFWGGFMNASGVSVAYEGVDGGGNSQYGVDNVEVNWWLSAVNSLFPHLPTPYCINIFTPIVAELGLDRPLNKYENLPLRLFVYQNDSGLDFTGGDPANTIAVTVLYSVLDV
jgi:hypothetical protein